MAPFFFSTVVLCWSLVFSSHFYVSVSLAFYLMEVLDACVTQSKMVSLVIGHTCTYTHTHTKKFCIIFMQAHLKQGCFGTMSLWCLYWHACLCWRTFVAYSDATAVWLQSMAFLLYWKTDLLKRLCNCRDCFMKFFFFFLMSWREVELPVVKLLASIIIWLVRFLFSHKNCQSIWLNNEWRHDCKPFKFGLQFSLLIWAVSKLSKVSIRQRLPGWLNWLNQSS